MGVEFGTNWQKFYNENILQYIENLQRHPFQIIWTIIDIAIVVFLAYYFIRIVKDSRAWQLVKGIFLLIVATWVSSTKTKENVYKIVIATMELAKQKTGALIVIERDIKIKDIIEKGIEIDSEVSPQLLVNIFVPNTPLHDGAVIISNNKIAAAACVLPLADDKNIAKELGTRHRAAVGASRESDCIVIVVSEETGKISVAKDGTLIADVREDVLKRILINNVVTNRFTDNDKKRNKVSKIKQNIKKIKKN